MRSLLFAAALLMPSLCSAQVAGFSLGRSAYPMLYIDEYDLPDLSLVAMPDSAWKEAAQCLNVLGVTTAGIPKPWVAVIPMVRTIRVTDMTLDSLLTSEGDTAAADLGRFQNPTIGYALVHSNVVLVTEVAARRHSTLRHEALHFLLWRSRHIYGHPVEYFDPCDRDLHQ